MQQFRLILPQMILERTNKAVTDKIIELADISTMDMTWAISQIDKNSLKAEVKRYETSVNDIDEERSVASEKTFSSASKMKLC